MEVTIKESLDALRPLARQAKAAVSLERVLDGLIGLEGHCDELRREVENLKTNAEHLKAENEAATKEANRIRNDAARQADDTAQAADSKAEGVVSEAMDHADRIVSQARSLADAAKSEEEDARERLRLLTDQAAAVEARRAELTAEVDSLRERVRDLVK